MGIRAVIPPYFNISPDAALAGAGPAVGTDGFEELADLCGRNRTPTEDARLAELKARVSQMTDILATQVSPRSVAVIKRQVRAGYHQEFDASLALADHEMDASIGHPDIKEGVQSYVDKRAPQFGDI